MGGLSVSPPFSAPQRDSNWVPIGLGIAFVVIAMGIIAWFARPQPKPPAAPPPYAANLRLSDLKLSAAQNFVGATVTYLDGTIANTGNRMVAHVMVHVVFRDSAGQVAQVEDVPLRVLESSGPYPDGLDLTLSPLAPGQRKPFRLAFEHVSADWDQAYPALQVSSIVTR
jgi:hypothetical protein